jgi:osmotically-inducible protein OsmY
MPVRQLSDKRTDGTTLGQGIADKVSMYGVTPVAQRAAAAQATSLVGTASSTAITTDVKAAIIEIMNTLAALGAWKGSA